MLFTEQKQESVQQLFHEILLSTRIHIKFFDNLSDTGRDIVY
ncbi:Uncharacterized protein dnm_057990 [Desulfonema magnum]|uniref:Uncharacterized protein n=1 Tax=Desulfonema magnum TaxID=45655 RepID=A0A975GQC5_9BACT|nr:Uncharacterized protein dnm_057990 [Desulfonema magnum]